MLKKSINYFLVLSLLLEVFFGFVWLNMLTFNAAARQADILVHQAWTAQHDH